MTTIVADVGTRASEENHPLAFVQRAEPLRAVNRREMAVGVGAGKVYYIGTNLGASISAAGANGIELLRAIITPVVQPAVSSEKVRPHLIEEETSSLLVVFSDTAEDQSAAIQLHKPYRQATELYGGEGSLAGGNILNVKVPYQGVSVVRLD